MEVKEKTFWEMVKESISYVLKNADAWKEYSVIASAVHALEESEREMNKAFKAQDQNGTGGHYARKNQLYTTFFKKIYKLDRKLSFYAKDTGDKVLLNDVSIPESRFDIMPEKEALIKCSKIIQRGYEHLPNVANYAITVEELNDLNDEYSRMESIQPEIGIITNDRKSAGRSIKELIAEARQILGKLDDAFEGMINDEAFIDSWFAIRKIKGRRKPKDKNPKVPAEMV